MERKKNIIVGIVNSVPTKGLGGRINQYKSVRFGIDRLVKVDTRTITMDVPEQEVIADVDFADWLEAKDSPFVPRCGGLSADIAHLWVRVPYCGTYYYRGSSGNWCVGADLSECWQ